MRQSKHCVLNVTFYFFQMIKSQQLSLRNDAVRKLLGLPDTRAQVGYRAQKSPLEVPEMMQACPSTLCAVVIFIIRNWIMTLKLSWIQWSQLEDANLQTKSMPSDKGTASESTTPNFAMGSMDGNISASSSPEELLEVWMLTQFFLSWNTVPVWILMHIPICLSSASITVSGHGLPRSSHSTDQVSWRSALSDQLLATISVCKQWELVINIAHRTAVERNPDLYTALIGMGQTLFSNRLFPEAAVCFEHAIPKVCCLPRATFIIWDNN